MSNPESRASAGPDRLPLNDTLGFVEHRAQHGKPEEIKFDETGDNVAGIVTEVEVVEGGFGEFKVISIIGRDGGECRFAATGAVLNRRLNKVAVGDAIAVRRIEDGYSSEFKKAYRDYEVTVVANLSAPRAALSASATSPRALRHSPEVAKILAEVEDSDDEDDAGF